MDDYIVVLSDIHANELALLAAVADARRRYRRHRLKFWFLGDLFGRGPDPSGAWRSLLELQPELVLAGNHDWGLLGKSRSVTNYGLTDGHFRTADWRVLLAHRRELADLGLMELDQNGVPSRGSVYDFLAARPVASMPRPGVYTLHGGVQSPLELPVSPGDLAYRFTWDYVRDLEAACLTLATLQQIYEGHLAPPEGVAAAAFSHPPVLVLVGHWHHRILYQSGGVDDKWVSRVLLDSTYVLRATQELPVLLSPGSVGFSREYRDRDASYAVLCAGADGAWTVTFHAAYFDRRQVRRAMRDQGYPAETIKLLRLAGEPDDIDR